VNQPRQLLPRSSDDLVPHLKVSSIFLLLSSPQAVARGSVDGLGTEDPPLDGKLRLPSVVEALSALLISDAEASLNLEEDLMRGGGNGKAGTPTAVGGGLLVHGPAVLGFLTMLCNDPPFMLPDDSLELCRQLKVSQHNNPHDKTHDTILKA